MLDPTVKEALMSGDHGEPFAVLGLHEEAGRWVLRSFMPGAVSVTAVDRDGGKALATLMRLPDSELFEGVLAGPVAYRLDVDWGSHRQVLEDAYRFSMLLGEMDVWLLAEGTHHRPYEQLGAHPQTIDGVAGTRFAVWAPNARRVSVVGAFNNWDGRRHAMRRRVECGVWEIFVPHVGAGDLYKYEVKDARTARCG